MENGPMRARSCLGPGWLVLLAALGCGASKGNGATVQVPGTGGAAGAQQVQGSGGAPSTGGPPRAGEPCQQGACMQGLSCEHAGFFAGLCTAGCGSDAACGLLSSRARCFGSTNQECGLPCAIDIDCPMGTHCVALGSIGTQRACQLSH
jgi:hypothetical protein